MYAQNNAINVFKYVQNDFHDFFFTNSAGEIVMILIGMLKFG